MEADHLGWLERAAHEGVSSVAELSVWLREQWLIHGDDDAEAWATAAEWVLEAGKRAGLPVDEADAVWQNLLGFWHVPDNAAVDAMFGPEGSAGQSAVAEEVFTETEGSDSAVGLVALGTWQDWVRANPESAESEWAYQVVTELVWAAENQSIVDEMWQHAQSREALLLFASQVLGWQDLSDENALYERWSHLMYFGALVKQWMAESHHSTIMDDSQFVSDGDSSSMYSGWEAYGLQETYGEQTTVAEWEQQLALEEQGVPFPVEESHDELVLEEQQEPFIESGEQVPAVGAGGRKRPAEEWPSEPQPKRQRLEEEKAASASSTAPSGYVMLKGKLLTAHECKVVAAALAGEESPKKIGRVLGVDRHQIGRALRRLAEKLQLSGTAVDLLATIRQLAKSESLQLPQTWQQIIDEQNSMAKSEHAGQGDEIAKTKGKPTGRASQWEKNIVWEGLIFAEALVVAAAVAGVRDISGLMSGGFRRTTADRLLKNVLQKLGLGEGYMYEIKFQKIADWFSDNKKVLPPGITWPPSGDLGTLHATKK